MSSNSSAPGSFSPEQNALNLILKIKEPVAENVAKLKVIMTQLDPSGLNNVGTVHFARFLFLENETKFALFTAYDGTFEQYLADFIRETHVIFDTLLSFVEGGEALIPVQQNAKAFVEFIRANDEPSAAFYCAYPDKNVIQILNAKDPS